MRAAEGDHARRAGVDAPRPMLGTRREPASSRRAVRVAHQRRPADRHEAPIAGGWTYDGAMKPSASSPTSRISRAPSSISVAMERASRPASSRPSRPRLERWE